mgnify:CR=1 FL=1
MNTTKHSKNSEINLRTAYSEINLRTLDLKEFLPGGTTKFVQIFFLDLVLALV